MMEDQKKEHKNNNDRSRLTNDSYEHESVPQYAGNSQRPNNANINNTDGKKRRKEALAINVFAIIFPPRSV